MESKINLVGEFLNVPRTSHHYHTGVIDVSVYAFVCECRFSVPTTGAEFTFTYEAGLLASVLEKVLSRIVGKENP